ncbi:helix-turn-helix domain-containing protein [Myxococcota bacterium]|nr:helix-turn-helix domain-containing protein [Myxococcota bacterium]MCZ7619407.1 helix-turn-helix domain-containing protein [Myxococcota bacterium]
MARKNGAPAAQAEATPAIPAVWADGGASLAEAARFSGLGRSKLYQLMDDGKLPYTKVGRRRILARRGLVAMLERSAAATQ